MATVKRFEDLEVWKEARELVRLVYKLTSKFPKHEVYGLASQMQRAAVSVMSNIAEGFERGSNKEFIQFLYISRSSCGELRSQTYVALDLEYADTREIQELQNHSRRVAGMLHGLIEYLKDSDIKGHKFHEERTTYEMTEPRNMETLKP